jgi:hypothetical protein
MGTPSANGSAKKEGHTYRLSSDHEWSCAAGIGAQELENGLSYDLNNKLPGLYPWGKAWPPPSGAGNVADETLRRQLPSAGFVKGYNDGHATTAPVMTYPPNDLGIFDLAGNVREWCSEFTPKGDHRIARSSSWTCNETFGQLLSSHRDSQSIHLCWHNYGFRCVVEIDSAESSSASRSPNKEMMAFGGHRYQFVPERISWDEARAKAEKIGGHLATLTTAEENEWAGHAFLRHLPGMYANILLGGYRQGKDWQWVTGEPFKQTFWHPGEPNAPGDKAYLHLWRATNESEAIDWDDTWASLDHSSVGFLVEWDDDGK